MDQPIKEPVPKSALYLAVALAGGAALLALAPMPRAAIGLVTGEKNNGYFGPVSVIERYWFDPQAWWATGGFAVALLISLVVARSSASKLWTTIGCVLVYMAVGLVHEKITYGHNPLGYEVLVHLHTVLLSDYSAWVAAAVAAAALFLFGAGARFDPGRVAQKATSRA